MPPKRPRAKPLKRKPLLRPAAEAEEDEKPKRAARRRGGRSRRRSAPAGPLEGTFDHGEEGYGLWLDPAVQDDPVYAEHWAGHRPVEITIEEDQIVIRRAGGGEDDGRLIRAAPPRSRGGARRIPCSAMWSSRGQHGSVLRTPSAPNFWDANFVRVEGDASDLEPVDLVQAADALLASSHHRKLEVEDEAAGARMRPFFEAAGWIADRNAVMLREGPAPAHADVEEVALLDTRPLRIEWYLSYENDEAAQDALAEAQDRISVRRGMRAFIVRGAGGFPVGFTTLAVAADGVEIEQLYVTPDGARRGHRRPARRRRARRGRARDGLGDRRRRRSRPRALRAARVRDRLAPARVRQTALGTLLGRASLRDRRRNRASLERESFRRHPRRAAAGLERRRPPAKSVAARM